MHLGALFSADIFGKMVSQSASETTLKLMALVEDGEIDEALLILNSEDEIDSDDFIKPWGSLQVTLVQLAAWRGSLEILKFLAARGADLNATDKLGRCALHHAAHQGHVDVVKWLVENGVIVETRFGISFLPKNEPFNVVVDSAAPNYEIGKNLPLPGGWGRTALHQAVEGKHVEVVKLLVDAGANVDACDERGVMPLHLASSNLNEDDPEKMLLYEKVIDILVSATAYVNFPCPFTGVTALHDAVRLCSPGATEQLLKGGACPSARLLVTGKTPLHIAVSTGSHQVLDILLAYVGTLEIDVRDLTGKTPLHEAVYHGHLRCIRALVDCGGNLAAKEICGETVIAAIFGHVASPMLFLADILDARVHATDNTTSQIILDFRVLTPPGELQMAVVSALLRAVHGRDQIKILQHPVVEAFLGVKWSHLRCFFYSLVAVHVFFLLSLSGYAMILVYWDGEIFEPYPRWLLFSCACILICHNMLQIRLMPRYYVRQFETWLSMTSVSISAVVGFLEDVILEETVSPKNVDPAPSWKLPFISVAILLAWIEMMLLVARIPTWGYYALMFSTVLKNVLKVLLAFVWLIIGFALSFSILFHNIKEFCNPWKSLVKTVVMMTGEYEYGDLFFPADKNDTVIDSTSDHNLVLFISQSVFLIFVMLASIVLMNLLIGLAVSDIQGLLDVGHIRRLMKQAEFVAHLERLTSHRIFRKRWIPGHLTAMLKSKNTISTRLTLEKSTDHRKGTHGISGQLVETLFDLASANWDLDQEFQPDSSCGENEDVITESILYLQERIKELQREKTRVLRKHSLKRKGAKRRRPPPVSD